MSFEITWSSDILDEDVQDELERRLELELRPRAIADGVELGDYKQVREWIRRCYEAGDPEVRDAMGLMALRRGFGFGNLHEPPYFWDCITSLEHLFLGCADPISDAALSRFQEANADLCADVALADGVDVDDEDCISAWVRGRYEAGDATVRRGLLAEAAWKAIHDFELSYETSPLASCLDIFAEDEIMGTFWDRGAYEDLREDGDNGNALR